MSKNKSIFNLRSLFFVGISMLLLYACNNDDDQTYEQTRLFRPVLNEDLYSVGNTIIVNMGKLKSAVGYTLEVSRDTFQTVDYTIEIDTNYVEINKDLVGEELFWNTLYQVQATAHAEDPQYDSKVSELGNVRTQRFPTILNIPAVYDVTDIAARVTWEVAGAAVTGIKVFAATDLRLEEPLFDETPVSEEENLAGEGFVYGLSPETEYQIAIYSGEDLRGWVNYTTKLADVDPTDPNVIDLREDESPEAVANAVAMAPDGAIILVKRGVSYDLPEDALDKSITIRAAYGFGEKKARLYTTGNWNIAGGSNIDHIHFVDLEIRGADYSGDYVFNPNTSDVYVRELLFDNCQIGTFRGIMRIRGTVEIDNYKIMNSVVDSIGGYGLATADTDPAGAGETQTARFNNIIFENSTFNKIDTGIQSRNNSQTLVIESCTFANFINTGGRLFRYRGGDGNDNVISGITISNSIFGHSWDQSDSESYGIQGIGQGLGNTPISLSNIYSTANFSFNSGSEIPGFPVANYSGTQDDLWVDPANNDFNIQDNGFSGKYDTGDPRWRVKL
ncbi:DUF5123 domain-containing protein [Robertkochia solimangrovi]|uniref:DUF5123 domain-containing protein n=1 Tax=Robertkochia solimangrovi TaxID=2213046 RepID=UPI0011805052|nr:DUF5123 domain-containing protein [Robertkochia solimangrovi]TRZ43698.1 DUF5123 domain-containing protein [Robertkochia solimangrovi]